MYYKTYYLNIPIECTKTSCSTGPDNFCRWFHLQGFGRLPTCRLFPTEDLVTWYRILETKQGLVQRCKQCIDFGRIKNPLDCPKCGLKKSKLESPMICPQCNSEWIGD